MVSRAGARPRAGAGPGFRRARFSGLSTPLLADWLIDLGLRQPALEGLYHVAADPIDKCTLLDLFARAFRCVCTIDPMDHPPHRSHPRRPRLPRRDAAGRTVLAADGRGPRGGHDALHLPEISCVTPGRTIASI
jgi:hypothetical protein